MSKRAKPAKPAVLKRRLPTTRGKRSSPGPDDEREPERGDDDDDDQTSSDELELFVRSPPLLADRLHIVAITHAGDVTVQSRAASEAKRAPVKLAESIARACAHWATVEGRATKFRATWIRGEDVLAAHQWEDGEGRDPTELDGTVESFLIQQQRSSESKDRFNLESWQTAVGAYKDLIATLSKRNAALEELVDELRERLRKVDDVSAEIAIEASRADLEQRGRTTDLLEKRLLPLIQHIVVKQLESQTPATPAPAAASGAAA